MSITKSFRNLRTCRHSILQWTTASYHATGQCRSGFQDSDAGLLPPNPNSILNRPRLNRAKLSGWGEKYGKNNPQLRDGDETARYYKSRVGENMTYILSHLWANRLMAMVSAYSPRQEAQAYLACGKSF